jgi:hypothetical protein
METAQKNTNAQHKPSAPANGCPFFKLHKKQAKHQL